MTFGEAIRSGFDHYVKFDGRASRPAFWWWVLFVLLVDIAANLIDLAIGAPIFSAIVGLGLLLPNLSVSIRRLHDTNRSGWWILIWLIPLLPGFGAALNGIWSSTCSRAMPGRTVSGLRQ